MSTRQTVDTADTDKTRTSGVYDRDFQQNLIDGGVYPYGYEYPDERIPPPPENWMELNQLLHQRRPSLSPSRFSENEFIAFQRADVRASKEKQVSESVIPAIVGADRDSRCVAGGIPFGNLEHLTDGSLKPGNPDVYYGARPEQLRRNVRVELNGSIVPSTQDDLPILPNFFLAVKGPDGSQAVAERSACYDGALGARGMQALQSYGQEQLEYDHNAYTVTSIYHRGTLRLFTSYPVEGTGLHAGRSEYYMHQIRAYAMTSDSETFRCGATAFRNLQDWAEEQRNVMIARANGRVSQIDRMQSTASAITSSFTSEVSGLVAATSLGQDSTSQGYDSFTTHNDISYDGDIVHQGSDTSTSVDELALGVNLPAKRPSRSQHTRRRKWNTSEMRNRGSRDQG